MGNCHRRILQHNPQSLPLLLLLAILTGLLFVAVGGTTASLSDRSKMRNDFVSRTHQQSSFLSTLTKEEESSPSKTRWNALRGLSANSNDTVDVPVSKKIKGGVFWQTLTTPTT
jgi:hypothetical protein